MRKIALAIIVCIFTSLSAKAQLAGESVFEFLRLPASSHAAALGGHNVSIIEDDATLAIENPALLQSVSHQTISLGYMNYMKGVSDFSAGYVHAINDKATVGGYAQYINYGKLDQTDANNNIIGTFNPSDLALAAQLSYNLGKNFVGGITAKFLYSSIGNYSSTAIAVDLGVNYYSEEHGFSASLVARNLGGQLSAYYDDYAPLPFDLVAGASYHFKNTPIRVSLTFDNLTCWDYSFLKHMTVGLDLIISNQFYISGGYNARRGSEMAITSTVDGEEQLSSHGAGWSFGAGLQLSRFKLHASYAIYHVASSSLLFNVAYTL